MKKKGFVFIETIVVLVIVVLSLTMIFSSYALVARKSKEKNYYNLPSDIYFLYHLSKIGTTNTNSYYHKSAFFTNKTNCASSPMNEFMTDCNLLMSDNDMVNFGTIKDIKLTLNSNASSLVYDNGTIDFLKTLKSCNEQLVNNACPSNASIDYLVGVFYRNREYYYAALEIEMGD